MTNYVKIAGTLKRTPVVTPITKSNGNGTTDKAWAPIEFEKYPGVMQSIGCEAWGAMSEKFVRFSEGDYVTIEGSISVFTKNEAGGYKTITSIKIDTIE